MDFRLDSRVVGLGVSSTVLGSYRPHLLGARSAARAPMDNTVLAVATIVLGLVGAAVFFLSQPAQAKSRSTGGSMKPRGEGGSNPCNHMAQHALSTLPVFWQTTGTNNEAAASQSNRSTRSCLDAVVRYGSDPHWVTHVALGIELWCGTMLDWAGSQSVFSRRKRHMR